MQTVSICGISWQALCYSFPQTHCPYIGKLYNNWVHNNTLSLYQIPTWLWMGVMGVMDKACSWYSAPFNNPPCIQCMLLVKHLLYTHLTQPHHLQPLHAKAALITVGHPARRIPFSHSNTSTATHIILYIHVHMCFSMQDITWFARGNREQANCAFWAFQSL